MKCPHCNYVEKRDAKTYSSLGKGGFFILDLGEKMWRWSNTRDYSDVANIIGCPNCRKTFIDFELFNFDK